MQVENWNDLRYLLALHRAGTLTGAAGQLGVDQTTVTRRLRALEADLGTELYEKLRGGAVFTRVGAEMVQTAERLEQEMMELEARLLGGQAHMEGPVRITMPSVFAVELMQECRDFARAFPGIELELVADDGVRSISRREVDIALRMASRLQVPEHLVGRKVGRGAAAVFGVRRFENKPWEDVPWIGWPHEEWTLTDVARKKHGNGPWAFRASTTWAVLEAVRTGAGVTVLACGCPRVTRGLVALTEPEEFGDIWLLTHPELRRSPRIRASVDYWYEVLRSRAPAFAGREA
jgi:DNA-binding transcriptional LysR family regulator